MREISAATITKAIRDMCIEANYGLAPDMRKVFEKAVEEEESPLLSMKAYVRDMNRDISVNPWWGTLLRESIQRTIRRRLFTVKLQMGNRLT